MSHRDDIRRRPPVLAGRIPAAPMLRSRTALSYIAAQERDTWVRTGTE
jgi:hypothetical protein